MTITAIHDCRIDNLPFIMGCEYEAEPFLILAEDVWITSYIRYGGSP